MSAESPLTPTPATAERLARALDALVGPMELSTECFATHSMYVTPANQLRRQADAMEQRDDRIREARAALAAYVAEGGKL